MRTSHRSSGNRSPATANRPALGWARACYGVDLRGHPIPPQALSAARRDFLSLLPRNQLSNFLYPAPIIVTKGQEIESVLNRLETYFFQEEGSFGSDPLDKLERVIERTFF